MTSKTALLSGIAGLMLMAAPALAQDAMTPPQSPQTTPPSSDMQAPPAMTPTDPAQPTTLQLSPGASVKGSDGTVLGTLEGVQNGASGQELTVRGSDGQLRGVPTTGIKQEGADVVVGWSSGEYQAAPAIADAAPPAAETPMDESPEAAPASTTDAPPAPAPDAAPPPSPVPEATPPAPEMAPPATSPMTDPPTTDPAVDPTADPMDPAQQPMTDPTAEPTDPQG